MKNILALILAVAVCLSFAACGKSSTVGTDGKSSQTTNEMSEQSVDKTTIDYKGLTVDELKNYYDTTKFIGTPRVEEGFVATVHSGVSSTTKIDVYMIDHDSAVEVNAPEGYSDIVYCIVVDNDTPDNISDDKIAHHWFELSN